MTVKLDPALSTVTLLLDRAAFVLRNRTAEDRRARDLAHEVTNLQMHASLLTEFGGKHATPGRIADLTELTAALHERVRGYCDDHRIRYVTMMTPDPFETTQRMSRDELDAIRAMAHGPEVIAAVEAMPARASEPPPALMPLLLDAQSLAREERRNAETIPAPPSTEAELPETVEEP